MSPKKPMIDIFSGFLVEDRAKEITIQGVETYPELTEKPQINGVTLSGNKTSSELYLASADELAEDVESLTELIDQVSDDSVVDIERPESENLELSVTYGDDVVETIDLDHLHSQYLTQHQSLTEYAKTSEVADYLEDKANINLANVTAGYDWVVVSNSTSKYRTWRNGWTECRGIITTTASTTGTEVTLPLPFKDTNYIVSAMPRAIGNFFISYEPVTTQKFIVRTNNYHAEPISVEISWEAKGYIS